MSDYTLAAKTWAPADIFVSENKPEKTFRKRRKMPHPTWRKWLPKTVQKEQQSPSPQKGEKRPFTWRKWPQLEGEKAP